MSTRDSRTQIWNALQKEIQSPGFLKDFGLLKGSRPELDRFAAPPDLIGFFHTPNTDVALKDKLMHCLLSDYRTNPKSKGWLMSLLLLISWKWMNMSFCRFRGRALPIINSYDLFAPVYESYIDAFLDTSLASPDKIILHVKDRAEYLIKKELKECERYRVPLTEDIPAPDELPWAEEIEEMISTWTIFNILTKEECLLVIYHAVYEYTFKEIALKQGKKPRTIQKQFRQALKRLEPFYLKIK